MLSQLGGNAIGVGSFNDSRRDMISNVSTVAVAVRAITLIPAGKILLRSPILEKALLNSSLNF